jgi:hypothetical protein
LALSYHVDYWNYLGWPDTLASAENTARQRSYAEVRGTSRIYTPQLIVNGTADIVGSDRPAIEQAIAGAALPVAVDMHAGTGTVEIAVPARPSPEPVRATIRLALLSSEARVAIARGENAGATIAYHNIVKAIRPIGMWEGNPVKITLPADELMGDGVDGCAVIVQADLPQGPGPILGAAKLRRW